MCRPERVDVAGGFERARMADGAECLFGGFIGLILVAGFFSSIYHCAKDVCDGVSMGFIIVGGIIFGFAFLCGCGYVVHLLWRSCSYPQTFPLTTIPKSDITDENNV